MGKKADNEVISWWVSCPKFTVLVETDDDGVIGFAAPIVSKFTGQNLLRLRDWARKFGEVDVVEL